MGSHRPVPTARASDRATRMAEVHEMWPGDGSEMEILQLLWREREELPFHCGVGESTWPNHGSMKTPVTYCSMNMSLTRRLFKPLLATTSCRRKCLPSRRNTWSACSAGFILSCSPRSRNWCEKRSANLLFCTRYMRSSRKQRGGTNRKGVTWAPSVPLRQSQL